jgi:hypothetical protein
VLVDEHQAGIQEVVACDQNHPEQSWCERECGVGAMINTSEFGSVSTGAMEKLELRVRGE